VIASRLLIGRTTAGWVCSLVGDAGCAAFGGDTEKSFDLKEIYLSQPGSFEFISMNANSEKRIDQIAG
jgi:hypothetical protein